MWNRNPRCERCKVLTILPKDCPDKILKDDGGFDLRHPPNNMATIQHRYSKSHKKRMLPSGVNGGERRHFLWCYKCNQEYNDLYENPSTKDRFYWRHKRKKIEQRKANENKLQKHRNRAAE